MLNRRLSLKLYAPTALLSLLLVGTCVLVARNLNQLHVNLAHELRENFESMRAADNLETNVHELINLLRDDRRNPARLAERITAANQKLRLELLPESERLANLEPETALVQQIHAGVDEFDKRWHSRQVLTPPPEDASNAALAKLLEEQVIPHCRQLRSFNIDQVGASDRANSLIVSRLTSLLIAVSIIAPIGALLGGYFIARNVYQSIYQLGVHIRDAAGRLQGEIRPVTLEEPHDLPDLNRQMQGVIEKIEQVVEQLQQREREVLRAEQLAAVGQVAAGVAHELRNPLTSVKMLVQTGLEEPQPTGLPPEDLAVIEHEIRRMEACIQTFLDFARPPSSERRPTDLLAVMRRSLALIEGRARKQHVTLETDLPLAPVMLAIDGEQIHQVVLNLLLNALDALAHGGAIRIKMSAPTPERREAQVSIADTGPGIAPRIKERLFQPFVSSKETGLGLGLSICQRLIEAHGGTITGENTADGGAVFTFTLPSEREVSAAA
jgi:two-component system, NtrC family, sensor histidine kinase HydH